jgi:hypothetical protein
MDNGWRSGKKRQLNGSWQHAAIWPREFPDGETAQMIRELEEELRQQLRDLEE